VAPVGVPSFTVVRPDPTGLGAWRVMTRFVGRAAEMELFRNRTVVLAVLGSIVLGLVMFGGSVFLGQYFQVARGYAPTEAGLLTLPLVGGLMIASTVSGQLISRYGRWKGFLVAGAILTTTGLTLLSTMDHTTSIPLLGVYLGVLGLGVGMSMQNLVLAVQNSVDMTEIGSASSLVAFLRSMGGTIGVTVLGIVLSHRVSALLGVPASGASSGTSDLSQLDAAAAVAVRAAYGDAIGRVFLIAAIGSILTLVAVAFIKEVPLRTTVGREPASAEEPDAGPDTGGQRIDGPAPAPGGEITAAVLPPAELPLIPNPVVTSTRRITRSAMAGGMSGCDRSTARIAESSVGRDSISSSLIVEISLG